MESPFNVRQAREDTLACHSLIHFNNAGAALMPSPVSQALHSYLNMEEQHGAYETADLLSPALDDFYHAVAQLINCQSDEVAFVDSATRAWNMAIYAFKLSPGDTILTSRTEYGSNMISYLHLAQKRGVRIHFVPNDAHGQVDVAALEQAIDPSVKLIAITHIPTGNGLINPAAAIGCIAKAHRIPYLLDTCQSLGQMPIDVDAIGCDMLCGTGRKYLRGPRGTGFLYIRQSLITQLEPVVLDQHSASLHSAEHFVVRSDARRFECWEHSAAGKYALTRAIHYCMAWGLDHIRHRINTLANQLRMELGDLPGVTVLDDGIAQSGLITFTVDEAEPVDLKAFLASHKINVALSSRHGSLMLFEDKGLDTVLRASVHYYNTEDEIHRFIQVLHQFIRQGNPGS